MHQTLLTPQSIAVIGASGNPEKLGYGVVHNLLTYGFPGMIYPINPHEETILNLRVYQHIIDIPEPIDCAIIAIPAEFVPPIVKECVDKLIPLVIIISSGFREIGPSGEKLEEEIHAIIKHSQTHILGPNCMGLINAHHKLNASFAAVFPEYEPISFISQSGALGSAFLDWIGTQHLGIDQFISIGNKLDIDELVLLDQLQDQKVIACYLEDIRDGKKFMHLGYLHNDKRPVIVLKPGRSEQAVKAIASHTGSLAGGYNAIATGLKQSGYIHVETISDLFYAMKAFAWQPIPKDEQVAIITNAGGPAVITTDLLIEHGLSMATLSPRTQRILADKLPRSANMHNPVDVIGDALSDRYLAAMEAVLQEENVSSLIVLLTPQIMTQIEQTAQYIGAMRKYNKTILAAFIGGTLVEKGMQLLAQEKIPAFHFPEIAVRILSLMVQHQAYVTHPPHTHLTTDKKSPYYHAQHAEMHEAYMYAKKQGFALLPPAQAEAIVRAYGIQTPQTYTCATPAEAITYAQRNTRYPCALKITSPQLLHKSDIGAVKIDLKNEDELQQAFNDLSGIIENRNLVQAHIEIQSYIDTGTYLIVGATRDPSWGTILLFGQGGIYAELLKDVSRRISPVTDEDIWDMIAETKVAQILKGIRGQEPVHMDTIFNAIRSIDMLMQDYPFIQSIDINPLIVNTKDTLAIDVKILI